jgi:hypothetical protein
MFHPTDWRKQYQMEFDSSYFGCPLMRSKKNVNPEPKIALPRLTRIVRAKPSCMALAAMSNTANIMTSPTKIDIEITRELPVFISMIFSFLICIQCSSKPLDPSSNQSNIQGVFLATGNKPDSGEHANQTP